MFFCSERFQVLKSDFDVTLRHCSTFNQLKTQTFSERTYSVSASSGDSFSLLQFVTIFKNSVGKSDFCAFD
jgi:hypothetical protein